MKISSARIVVCAVALLLGSVLSPLTVGSAGAVTQPGVASTRLPVPADASSPANPNILGMSCGAPGFCVAVGTYLVPNGVSVSVGGLIDTWSGGTWTARRAPVPAGGLPYGGIAGVSCSGTSTCAAYGEYSTGPNTSARMALILTGGTWKAQAIGAPSGGTLTGGGSSGPEPISGVGCSGVDACGLVGNFYDSGNALRGWTSVYHSGSWEGAKVVPTPNDATGQESHLNGMSCGSGLCQAVGNYTNPAGWQPLVVSIDPSGDTVNSPSSPLPVPQGTELDDLTGVSCAASGSCAAFGSYYTSGGSNLEGLMYPVGGAGFQPQQPPTLTAESTTMHPATSVNAASCAGGTCIMAGYYYDTGSNYHVLLDRLGSGGWAADASPNNYVPSLAACGGSTFCLAVANTAAGIPIDVYTGGSWVAAPLVLPGDAVSFALTSAGENAAACDSSTSCWVLGNYSAVDGVSSTGAAFAAHVTPTPVAAPPTVSTSAMPTFALGSSTKFSWHGTAGSSPIDHYTVEVRRSTGKSGFGSWSTPSGWGVLSASTSSVNVSLPVGDDTCVRVQAVDTAHLASAWSSARCTARPLDDPSLSASSHWTRVKASGYYLGTYTSTKTLGATLTLTNAQFDRLALVATKCASCGKVAVYSGSTLLATINLYHSTTEKKVLIALSKVTFRTANIRLKVTTSGKTIQIDGLGVSRT